MMSLLQVETGQGDQKEFAVKPKARELANNSNNIYILLFWSLTWLLGVFFELEKLPAKM